MIKFKKTMTPLELVMLSLISLSLFYGYHRFWRVPRLAEYSAVQALLLAAMSEATLANQKMSELESTRAPATSEERKGARGLLDKYLKANDRFSRLLTQVSETKNLSLSLNKIATTSSTTELGIKKTLMSLDAEASFVAIGNFLEALEDSALLTEIDSIEIKRLATDMKLCNAKIKLYSYVAEP